MPTPVYVESSKVRVLNAPIQAPGTCWLCGASRSDDRGYIDIGKDIEFIGVIYFCTFCMTEVANVLGCLMPEQARALENELDAARQRIMEFETKDRALNGAIDTLRNTGLFSGVDPTVLHRSNLVVDAEESKQDTAKSSGDNPETEQSNSQQRPTDISATRSNEFDDFPEFR